MNSITFFLFFIPILALILLSLNLIFAPHNPYQEKSSTFECGFHSFLGQNRTQFNISFFVFGLLYLTFDLELVLALPGIININNIGEYGLSIILIFFVILTIGFAFELGKKALNIESKQTLPELTIFNSLLIFIKLFPLTAIVIPTIKKSVLGFRSKLMKRMYIISSHLKKNGYYALLYTIASVYISIKQYIKKFNYFELIEGFLILKIVTLSLACVLCLYILPEYGIFSVGSYIILLLIIYKLFIIHWKDNNIMDFFITLMFNSIIIAITITIVILLFNTDMNVYCILLPVSTSIICNDPFGSQLVLMDGGPSGGEPSSGGPSSGGPSNGGPNGGGPGPNRGEEPVVSQSEKVNDKEEKNNVSGRRLSEPAKSFIKGWYGLGTNDLRSNLDAKLLNKKVPSIHQQKSISKAFLYHFAEECDKERETDSPLDTLVQKFWVAEDENKPPFDTENKKVFTPDIERDIKECIIYLEKWVDKTKKPYSTLKDLKHRNEVPNYKEHREIKKVGLNNMLN